MRVTSVSSDCMDAVRNSLRVLLVPLGCAIHVLRKVPAEQPLYYALSASLKGVSVCVCGVSPQGEREREPFLSYWLIMEDSRSCS